MTKSKWIWAVLAGVAILALAADIAYREFYIRPLGVAYLVSQYPEIVSAKDIATASPEVVILDPVAFESSCADWIWGCYSVEAYRRVSHVYVMRQHGGLNEVIPCDPGNCTDGSDYQTREFTVEESISIGKKATTRERNIRNCQEKYISRYNIKICRDDNMFDGEIERSRYILSIPQNLALRPFVDSLPRPEIEYGLNYVSGNKYLGGRAAGLLEQIM